MQEISMTSLTMTTPSACEQGSPSAHAPATLYYIYGKHSSQSRFRPMNLSQGTRVVNLVYASRLTADEVKRFFDVHAPGNPEWRFEKRRIRTGSGRRVTRQASANARTRASAAAARLSPRAALPATSCASSAATA
jgi:hypothetical protein